MGLRSRSRGNMPDPTPGANPRSSARARCSCFQRKGEAMNYYYRWVIVGAGAFMGCVAIGSIFSLPVFLQPMSQDTGWSRTAISTAMTFDFITMGLASFGWGMVMDRLGSRIVRPTCSMLLGLGLGFGQSRHKVLRVPGFLWDPWSERVVARIFAPMMATVTGWFDQHRSLAVLARFRRHGYCAMTVAPIAARLVSTYDWRFFQFVSASPPGRRRRRSACWCSSPALANINGRRPAAGSRVSARAALMSPQFAILH